jgi:hypothetical protein
LASESRPLVQLNHTPVFLNFPPVTSVSPGLRVPGSSARCPAPDSQNAFALGRVIVPCVKSILGLLLLSIGASALSAGSDQPIFIIERSTNANVIHYDAKIGKDGALDPKEPVVAYWIMLAEDGRRQKLSALERSRAYGFTIRRDASDQSYWMTLVSQKRRTIHIYQQNGKVRAVTVIGGHEAYLRKIYVKTRKSGLLRTADYFELFGDDLATGQDCYEKVAPEH